MRREDTISVFGLKVVLSTEDLESIVNALQTATAICLNDGEEITACTYSKIEGMLAFIREDALKKALRRIDRKPRAKGAAS